MQKNILNGVVALSLLISTELFALPDINQVVNGEVNIAQGEKALQVNQNSDKAIVTWNSFNIDAHEKVHFQQPINGICLNRIDATNGMSQIAGSLSATAKVIFINNAGILFSDTAQVNVGNIIASVIDISDDNFLNYRPLNFDQQSSIPGAIINRGVINVQEHGLAALIGNSVSNEGIILASRGQVVLEAGNKFTVDFYGEGIINFELATIMPGSTTMAGVDENGNPLPNAVNMSGQIINDGGGVLLMASAVPGIFDNLINMSGDIQARYAVATDSGVALIGDKHGIVNVTGKIDATGSGKNIRGGSIIIAGDEVVIDDKASLNVSADFGWGYIALGDVSGEFDYLDTPYNKTLYVGPNVTLIADAYSSGSGGGIFMRSNLETKFLGTAYARGTHSKYSGGYVQIASKGDVRFYEAQAKVDVSKLNGGKFVITKQFRVD